MDSNGHMDTRAQKSSGKAEGRETSRPKLKTYRESIDSATGVTASGKAPAMGERGNAKPKA